MQAMVWKQVGADALALKDGGKHSRLEGNL